MKKILLSVAVLAGLMSAGVAQTTVGIKAGLNLSNYSYEAGDTDGLDGASFKSKVGGQLGFVVNSQINDAFSIRPELILSSKGSTIEFDGGGTFATTGGYLDIPLNFVYGIPVGESLKVDVYAGPYVGFGLGGYYRMEDSDGELVEDGNIRFKKEPAELKEDEFYLNGMDAGFNFGVGLHVAGLIVSVNYQLGLSNVMAFPSEEPDGYDRTKVDALSNRVTTIGVTYLFGN